MLGFKSLWLNSCIHFFGQFKLMLSKKNCLRAFVYIIFFKIFLGFKSMFH